MLRTIDNLRLRYPRAPEHALQEYIDLRNEGYSVYQAEVMAGLADPEDSGSRHDQSS